MIRCGSQCLTCDYPINFDTYMGCSHACKYCYVKGKYSIKNVEPIKMAKKFKVLLAETEQYIQIGVIGISRSIGEQCLTLSSQPKKS